MKEYVLGFAFNENKTQIVLILKNRPDWQKGKFNGIGGKIEPSDELPVDAMVREFYEETGCVTSFWNWQIFAEILYENDKMGEPAKIYCFRIFTDSIKDCSTVTDEVVEIFEINYVKNRPLRENLHVLIPLALQTEFRCTILKQ